MKIFINALFRVSFVVTLLAMSSFAFASDFTTTQILSIHAGYLIGVSLFPTLLLVLVNYRFAKRSGISIWLFLILPCLIGSVVIGLLARLLFGVDEGGGSIALVYAVALCLHVICRIEGKK